jgi:hypothetical protein
MAKRITVRNKAFTQGYICACAIMIQEHGNSTEVYDCLRGNFISLDNLRRHEVDEHDIEILMPIINEIERKRALANSD